MNKWSLFGIKTYKENPSDAEIPSHQLLIRAGLVKKLSSGIYTYGPLFLRSLRKLEAIVRKEHERVGVAELLMPMVQPKDLWVESGRWGYPDMQTFKNKKSYEFCLGPTHEEVITDYVRNDITSYKELPLRLFQIQTKYRDEIRPRFGLMRGREFLMKDAYTFDADQKASHESYYKMREAYVRILDQLGLDYRIVKADAGAIGGSLTEEFQVLADIGEDELLVSDSSDYAANIEICPRLYQSPPTSATIEAELKEVSTPNLRTIDDLAKAFSKDPQELVKTMFFEGEREGEFFKFSTLLRGSDQVNLVKMKNHLNLTSEPRMLTDEEVFELTSAQPGSCGPVGLKIPIYADIMLKDFKSMFVGANKDDLHLTGVQPSRDFEIEGVFDLSLAQAGDLSPDGKGVLKSIRGIEVGHIFYLGTKYSKSLNAKFLDSQGKAQFFEMGCYGIGMSRMLQSAVEQSHDEDGIVWPKALAPFDVHLCLLDKSDEINAYVEELEKALFEQGLSLFVDDRKERPGVKFKDADLMGFPLRVTIGKKSFNSGKLDIYIRAKKEKLEADLKQAAAKIKELYEQA